ncbi:LAFE_0B03290g1_1 [Lachancea fermentati]|uniref:LAFE_0B03290g1_1 n=1 Tax=Lachancea fermentati TaxID=4955 RepID=A0A1G4M7K2_LACFM|nr:LAFE_0B03290g1_1 [Lachancea fermentati]
MKVVIVPLKAATLLNPNCLLRPATFLTRYYATQTPRGGNSTVLSSVYTIPNMLTMTRIAVAPLIGHYIISNNVTPALCLFTYSCVTDFLDGYLARTFKMKSVAGTILDPMADKLLMLVTTASLSYPGGPQVIPPLLAGLIIGRDFLLALSAVYFRFTSMKHAYGRVTWSTFWDFFHYPSAEVRPTRISKWNTFLQMVYLGWGFGFLLIKSTGEEQDEKESQSPFHESFRWMGYLVGATTVLSGFSYVFSKNAVRFLRKIK